MPREQQERPEPGRQPELRPQPCRRGGERSREQRGTDAGTGSDEQRAERFQAGQKFDAMVMYLSQLK